LGVAGGRERRRWRWWGPSALRPPA